MRISCPRWRAAARRRERVHATEDGEVDHVRQQRLHLPAPHHQVEWVAIVEAAVGTHRELHNVTHALGAADSRQAVQRFLREQGNDVRCELGAV